MRAAHTHTFQMAHTIYEPYGTILFGRFFCCSPTLLLLPRLTFFVFVFPLVAFFTHTLSIAWFFLRRSLVAGLKGVFSSSTSLYSFPSASSPASQHNRGYSGVGTTGDPLRGSVVLRSRREASNSNFRCITRSCRTAETERTKLPMLHHRFTRRRQKHKP